MNYDTNLDWEEAYEYQPGFIVEFKGNPGVYDVIASYEMMMVPPIWLVNDPKPRYAHELKVVSRGEIKVCCLESEPQTSKTSKLELVA